MRVTVDRASQIAGWIRQRLAAAGADSLVLGLSGGVDSAVVARLCQMAAPGRTIGVIMPCENAPEDESDAALIADHFALTAIRVDLTETYGRLASELNAAIAVVPPEQLGRGGDPGTLTPFDNVTPRLRMTTLYFVANACNALVAGTGNRSTLTVGSFTKYGDGGVDVLPIGGLLTSEVRELARELEVPEAIISRPAGAGLWTSQTDERQLGFTYADLDRYLALGPAGVAPALAMKVERLVRTTEHKLAVAPSPDL